jgi:monovalent cation:H+ antiporter-2, CPA2 family
LPHETGLITTITLALAAAFVGGFVASRLRMPSIVGYLLAGVAIGPFTPGFVADGSITQQLAEIGIVLLMFGVGIHFSLRDLLSVRGIVVPGALIHGLLTTLLGVGLGLWWGWGLGGGLVLGLAISVASTVVLLRALGERGELESPQGRIALGWLIVEDLRTVLVLVLLPALAGSLGANEIGAHGSIGSESVLLAAALVTGKVVVLGALVMVVGNRVVPYLLVQVARTGSRELFTLGVLAIALGIAYMSSEVFGVSLALGAFLAGAVVSESDFSHQAAADALPLRDAFAVLFFVSVGMLFDPSFLLTSPVHALAVLLVIMVGKPLLAAITVLAFGYPIRAVLTVAAGLGQIGEFSFILAAIGRTLGILPEEGYALILVGALFSITLNPLIFRTIGPIESWLRAHPAIASRLAWRKPGKLAMLPQNGEEVMPRGHAIICGFGRVGSVVGESLRRRGFPYVVVELSRRRVESMRAQGIPALYGDASNPHILDASNLSGARILVVALPDPAATRQIVNYAKKVAPRLGIVARSHSATEREYLYAAGAREVVVGETELALEMTRHTLHRFGVGSTEILALLQTLRLEHGNDGEPGGRVTTF